MTIVQGSNGYYFGAYAEWSWTSYTSMYITTYQSFLWR